MKSGHFFPLIMALIKTGAKKFFLAPVSYIWIKCLVHRFTYNMRLPEKCIDTGNKLSYDNDNYYHYMEETK